MLGEKNRAAERRRSSDDGDGCEDATLSKEEGTHFRHVAEKGAEHSGTGISQILKAFGEEKASARADVPRAPVSW